MNLLYKIPVIEQVSSIPVHILSFCTLIFLYKLEIPFQVNLFYGSNLVSNFCCLKQHFITIQGLLSLRHCGIFTLSNLVEYFCWNGSIIANLKNKTKIVCSLRLLFLSLRWPLLHVNPTKKKKRQAEIHSTRIFKQC